MNLQHFLSSAKDKQEISRASGIDDVLSIGKKYDTLNILARPELRYPHEARLTNKIAFAKSAARLAIAAGTRCICIDAIRDTLSKGKGRNMLTTVSTKLPALTPVYDSTDDFI